MQRSLGVLVFSMISWLNAQERSVTPFEMVLPQETEQGAFSPQAWYAAKSDTELTVVLVCLIKNDMYCSLVYYEELEPRTFVPYDTFLAVFPEVNLGGLGLGSGMYYITFDAMLGKVFISNPPLTDSFYYTGIQEAPANEVFDLSVIVSVNSISVLFSLGYPAEANLKVYDAAGSLIETLSSGRFSEGGHNVSWDTSNVPEGVYFLRMNAPNVKLTRKVLVVR